MLWPGVHQAVRTANNVASVPATSPRGRMAVILAGAGAVTLGGVGALLLTTHQPVDQGGAAGSAASAAAGAVAPAPWTPAQLGDLLAAIRGSAAEGLRPADYKLDALQQAVDGGRWGATTDALADAAAAALAHDYAAGCNASSL
jgi:hypothetical protein